jgi:hypothetical protein
LRIVAELIFICPKAQDWQKNIFAEQVHRILDNLKNTKIRTKGLEISIVMNSGPHWLSAPGHARREHKKACEAALRGEWYGLKEKEERLPTRAEIEHLREKHRRQNAKKKESEFE